MTKEEWGNLNVQTYGLPTDLFVPIAATDTNAIEKYVGKITKVIYGRKRSINAVVVEAIRPIPNTNVPL